MQQTTNYNLLIPEGTDVVNPLTQVNPNFQTIDGAMFANKQASIGTASEVVTGTVHAIIRSNTDSDVFRFTATGAWTAGDTMTLDGQSVTVHLSDGTTPATGAYIIGAEVVAVVNGTLVTLLTSAAQPVAGVTSFNSRTGAVVPTASDYDASMVDYDNTSSGLTSTDVNSAIDEVNTNTKHGVYELWENPSPLSTFVSQTITLNNFDSSNIDALIIPVSFQTNETIAPVMMMFDRTILSAPGSRTLSVTVLDGGADNLYSAVRNVTFTLAGTTLSIAFDGGYHIINSSGTVTRTADDGVAIPTRILALVHNS